MSYLSSAICVRCGKEWMEKEFGVKVRIHGKRYICKACRHERYLRDREKQIEWSLNWRKKNRERYNAYMRKYMRERRKLTKPSS